MLFLIGGFWRSIPCGKQHDNLDSSPPPTLFLSDRLAGSTAPRARPPCGESEQLGGADTSRILWPPVRHLSVREFLSLSGPQVGPFARVKNFLLDLGSS